MSAATLTVGALTVVSLVGSSLEPPPPDDGFFSDIGDGDGIHTGFTVEQTQALAESYPPAASAESPVAWYDYVAVIDCIPPNSPERPRLEICGFAVTFCEENVPDSSGPRSIIYRRTGYADGTDPTSWEPIGPTCHTDSVPARSGEPAVELTEAMIVEQFHRTDFALPQTVIQPPDGTALVNLPVYFELAWPDAGFSPAEVDTTTLVGRQVRIRPTLVGATYVTGDGTAIGPTTSLGGPYPDGDVTHTYDQPADVAPFITVEYGGEVSVDGGPWTTIPSTATVDGPAVDLQVLTSRNRLYSD
ncbi:hypothetical protein [uncultured Ornithinimicrobium sp.]|uniref:hypothetical protein n=1 Tax=uncultured Ornithinimicrobium sp. TaxID=259307 RepID=UPI00259921E5|nr:hypothetical protein [uncultured Ornithinimicrobium sp.]